MKAQIEKILEEFKRCNLSNKTMQDKLTQAILKLFEKEIEDIILEFEMMPFFSRTKCADKLLALHTTEMKRVLEGLRQTMKRKENEPQTHAQFLKNWKNLMNEIAEAIARYEGK